MPRSLSVSVSKLVHRSLLSPHVSPYFISSSPSFFLLPLAYLCSSSSSPFSHRSRAFTSVSPVGTVLSSPPFSKVLIANRGEIAVRLIKAAKRQGMKTVGVYTYPEDAQAYHLRFADEVIRLLPVHGRHSTKGYLNPQAILDAALHTGAQAVHPGYGFLSENPALVELLDQHNITFVGPPLQAVHSMGDKLESKLIAKRANVSMIPGILEEITSFSQCRAAAMDIGYPVMLKAVAGGGGKGMRACYDDKQLQDAWRICKAEAAASFNDERLIIEKFIEKPRHIEIQIIADKHGHYFYFPERECSIQRRNQKVLEESPSSLLINDPHLRKQMGEQAIALAKEVGYYSAGTIEMLVSGVDKSFYFLEMNTRLQVEHPVTEAISGCDLPMLMFHVAAGRKLDFLNQHDLAIPKGWAMEARIYAENPYRNFLPSIGRLKAYGYYPQTHPPPLSIQTSSSTSTVTSTSISTGPSLPDMTDLYFDPHGIRMDHGVKEGSNVSVYYDPLLAKLIAYGPTRSHAIQAMRDALDSYLIEGVISNLPFISAVIRHPLYQNGDITTKFYEEQWPDGFKHVGLSNHEITQVMTVALLLARDSIPWRNQNPIAVDIVGAHAPQQVSDSYVLRFNDACQVQLLDRLVPGTDPSSSSSSTQPQIFNLSNIDIQNHSNVSLVTVDVNGIPLRVQRLLNPAHTSLSSQGRLGATIHINYRSERLVLTIRGLAQQQLEARCKHDDDSTGDSVTTAPMPGNVVSLAVQQGQQVEDGQELLVLEAMKMQNIIIAHKSGTIKKILCKPGDQVASDAVLIEYER